MKKKRKDTKLVSTGAEFVVLGRLLLHEIQTYKTYVNFEGYDLVSVNPSKNKSAKIQVKSKNFVNDFSFYLNSVDKERADFYVFCHTSVYHYVNKVAQLVDDKKKKARFFVMDYKTVQKYKSTDKNGSDYLNVKSSVPNYEFFEENWKLIKDFLN
tara:strand:+ start:163 stop:627 length:465 start_codon:yes stop_codon:yes gene_type:complete